MKFNFKSALLATSILLGGIGITSINAHAQSQQNQRILYEPGQTKSTAKWLIFNPQVKNKYSSFYNDNTEDLKSGLPLMYYKGERKLFKEQYTGGIQFKRQMM